MATAFAGYGRPRVALAGEDYFDGPGEESWASLMPGDEPDAWWDVPEGCPAVDPDAGFGPGRSAEVMPAGVPLHLRVEQAVTDGLAGMADDAVVGVVAAARRLRARAEWLEVRATQEFARRRWEAGPVPQRDKDGGWRFSGQAAEFAADELAFELADSPLAASERMDLALALRDRLPMMAGQLAAGRGDAHRCQVVHDATSHLSDEHARQVDAELASEAPGLRYDALRRRARKLAIRLDPDSERERKERATRKKARVEVFGERSGNYALAGRELPIEEVLASKAHIRGLAQELHARGVPGGLRELELMCYLDLTQGRDPRDRIPGRDAPDGSQGSNRAQPATESHETGSRESDRDDHHDDDEGGLGDKDDDWNRGGTGGAPWPLRPPGPDKPGGRAPFPAKINLLVPVGTLLGWSSMPGEANREIIDPRTLRDLVQAASHHPATRWCVTIVGRDKTGVAHGCARGQHPWDPQATDPPPDQASPRQARPRQASPAPNGTPAAAQLDQLRQIMRRLKAGFEPIANGTCDHRHREDGYRPSRALGDLVRARNATCPAPGCGASSVHCDLDHTRAWPDGDTDECNLGPTCRHHHRLKQAPGWKLTQPTPGAFHWKTPSGRSYETGPTKYDL